ncbi:MAG: GTP cyclohydrolase I FolE [bacterium]
MDKKRIEKAVREILIAIGEDPEREGLRETPRRVADALEELLSGYEEKEENFTLFEEDLNEVVILKDIPFFSLCEHHLLPFIGKAHIAYLPNHKIAGVSKLVRTVEKYARRLQVQERLTNEIADELMERLKPKGLIVLIEAEHLCMTLRGVRSPGSLVITYQARGIYEDESLARSILALFGK